MENYSFLGKTIVLLQKTIVTLMKTTVENYSFSENYSCSSRNYSFCDRNYSFQPKTIVYFCKGLFHMWISCQYRFTMARCKPRLFSV